MTNSATSFTGRGVDVFAAAVLASSLSLYADHKMRVNRAYTPTLMMKRAQEITGKRFAARDYSAAAKALREWVEAEKLMAYATGDIR